MKKWMTVFLSLLLMSMFAACGNSDAGGKTSGPSGGSSQERADLSETGGIEEADESRNADGSDSSRQPSGNVLVAYFAYSENMGDISGMEADAIASASLNRDTSNTEGNLQVMAQVAGEITGADIFHILMEEPYDPDYSTMLPAAIEQMEGEDWPALQEKVEDVDKYDVVYLGIPVWNSVMPPAMHTFFAENDLSGKTIIPFGIHLGSRFGRMIDEIKELAPEAAVMDGFTVNAETANDEVRSQFRAWMEEQAAD